MTVDQHSLRNRILRELSPAAFAILAPDLKSRELVLRQTVSAPFQPIESVTFPENCVVSVIAPTLAGREAEVGLIGFEGLVGHALALDDVQSPLDCFVQFPGEALQIPAAPFRRALDTVPQLRSLVLRHVHNFSIQVSCSALAYSAFPVVERLARWLLMSHDRVLHDELFVTHDMLALMLGVRRAGITVAIQELEDRGCIFTRRGVVIVVDRDALRRAAADSYGLPEEEYRRQFETARA